MTSKSILENLYGLGSNTNDITYNTVNQNIARGPDGRELAKSRDFNDNVPKFKSKPKLLNSRQNEIYLAVLRGDDVFVSYPPSAGKTFPVLKSILKLYQEWILRINNKPAPHVLYVVPRKQLAAQIADNDFRTEFTNLISGASDDYAIPGFDPKKEFKDPIYLKDDVNKPLYYNKREGDKYAYNLVAEMTGGNKGTITTNTYDGVVPVIVATYEKAKDVISGAHGKKITHVIIDEVQELIVHPGEGISEDLSARYKSLTTILNSTSKQASIVLMTGSVNQNSIKYLSDNFNKEYNRNFKVIPTYTPEVSPFQYGDDSEEAKNTSGQLLNRSEISLKTMKSLSGFPTSSIPARINLIKNIVINKQFESVMIIFSKQTKGQGIFAMLETLKNILPAYPKGYFTEVANSHVTNVLNKKENPTLEDCENIEFLKYFDLNDVLRKNDTKGEEPDIPIGEKNEDNILYQSVIRGVAPLVGSMTQLHKKIIQHYFSKKKKIHMVLGTDALG